MMGSSVHLHVTAEDRDVIIIVPTLGMKKQFANGDELHFAFDGEVVHLFSKEDDRNLENIRQGNKKDIRKGKTWRTQGTVL